MGIPSHINRVREVLAAARLEHVRYAIRDIAVLAEQLAREGKSILPLNIGDPLLFDFHTPPHMIDAVAKAMRDGQNGYAPSLGIDEALDFPTYPFMGNTGSAAVPSALAAAIEAGAVKKGGKVAVLGIGSGLSSIMAGVEA